jgi:hypothetical protein
LYHTEELADLTNQLLAWNERIMKQFIERSKREADFYTEVKPFVEELDAAADNWKAAAEKWVNKEAPKYIHILQVQQTYDNIKKNGLDCFIPQVKEKHFKETYKAIDYVLRSILSALG